MCPAVRGTHYEKSARGKGVKKSKVKLANCKGHLIGAISC